MATLTVAFCPGSKLERWERLDCGTLKKFFLLYNRKSNESCFDVLQLMKTGLFVKNSNDLLVSCGERFDVTKKNF